MTAIPVAGVRALARPATRTALVRRLLATALVALVFLCAGLARRLESQPGPAYVPPRSAAVVVLDLSASISTDTYSRIGQTLRQLVARGGDYGLVVFSDIAYEALPPGTPAAALAPLVRYFTLPDHTPPGVAPTFPVNPWSRRFTAGTRISNGLELAREIVLDERLERPAVVLVSDLADSPDDVRRLSSILLAYRRDRIPLRVVALNPSSEDAGFFERLLGTGTAILPARLPGESGYAAPVAAGVPGRLVLGGMIVAALLALHTLWSVRLRWGSPGVPA